MQYLLKNHILQFKPKSNSTKNFVRKRYQTLGNKDSFVSFQYQSGSVSQAYLRIIQQCRILHLWLTFFIISQGPHCCHLLTCRFLSIEIQLIFLWYKDDPKITVSLPYEINQFTNLTNLLQLVLLKLNLWTWGESALPCC